MKDLSDVKVLFLHYDLELVGFMKNFLFRSGARKENIFFVNANNLGGGETPNFKDYDIVISVVGFFQEFAKKTVDLLRQQKARDQVKLIFISGGGEHFARQTADELGADAFITDYGTPANFMKVIRDVIARS